MHMYICMYVYLYISLCIHSFTKERETLQGSVDPALLVNVIIYPSVFWIKGGLPLSRVEG